MNTNDIHVRRFAVKYDPPTLVVEYNYNSRLFLKKIKIKIKDNWDISNIYQKLVDKHPNILGPDHVCRDQLIELLNLLAPQKNDSDFMFANLNKASDEELALAKAKMSVKFEQNRLKPGDPGYVWDKQVEFAADEQCEWDEDEED